MRRLKKYLCMWALVISIFTPYAGHAAVFPPKEALPLMVPLYLDKQDQGLVPVLIMPDTDESYVQASPVIAVLKPLLAKDKVSALETTIRKGFLRLREGAKGGVDMKFDDRLIAVVLTIPSESKKERSIQERRAFDPSSKAITPQSPVSAYLNVRGSQDYIETAAAAAQEGRQPFRMSTDGALNMHGLVLESSGDYIENNAQRPWQRGDTRLVYDLPDDMVRLAAGDLSYPVKGFQSFQPMLGVTMARNFDLQPYRVSEPTGQTSFFLKSPSRVEILVNGRRVQTLQLDSGPFDISDFPVVNGSNNVQLIITDATGRVEVKNIDIVSDATLLARGLSEYAYNMGIVSTTVNREKRYDDSLPALSAFHRYGLTDALTIGANVQADPDQQMSGIEATFGGKWGIVGANVSGSRLNDGDSGFAWRGQYQVVHHGSVKKDGAFDGARTLTFATTYRTQDFAPLGNLQPNNTFFYDMSTRYSHQLSPTAGAGIGGRYQVGRSGQADEWNYGFSLDKQLPHDLHAGVNFDQRGPGNSGVFLSLSWTPQGSRHFVTGSYDSLSKTVRADWNYAQAARSQSISASAGVVRTTDREEGNGSLIYYGNRGEITARHDIVSTSGSGSATESRSEMRFGTALAYSGGHVAFSRPISNSFAMVAPDPSIAPYPIGINPQGGDDQNPAYEATTDGWGPAVLPDFTPYLYRTLRVDAHSLPPGFDAGESNYTLNPGYRSGTFIKIGSDANVLLDGTLVHADGSPMALQAGSIRSAMDKDDPEHPFFTNRAGRFRIEKMRPGTYNVEMYAYPGTLLSVIIPQGAAGPTQAGTLALPEGVEP